MTKRISVFLIIAAVPAVILVLLIHTTWLLALGLGLLAVLFLATYISAPSGTGHVLDGLVSAVISSILIVGLAVVVQKHLDRSILRGLPLAGAHDHIRIVRHGRDVFEQPGAAFTTNVIRLLESCGYNSTDYVFKAGTWQERQQADSYVLLTFSPPRQLKVCTFMRADDTAAGTNFVEWASRHRAKWEIKSIDAILVSLPEQNLPDHILARSDTTMLAVTMMSPYVLRDVAFEPVLRLWSTPTYAALAGLPELKK